MANKTEFGVPEYIRVNTMVLHGLRNEGVRVENPRARLKAVGALPGRATAFAERNDIPLEHLLTFLFVFACMMQTKLPQAATL